MKFLCQIDWQWQLDLLVQDLEVAHIEIEVVQKAREYASIITGLSGDTYHVYVSHDKYISAAEILKRHLPENLEAKSSESEPRFWSTDFSKVLIYSMCALSFIPLVFNLIATRYYFKVFKSAEPLGRKILSLVILLLGWSVPLFVFFRFQAILLH